LARWEFFFFLRDFFFWIFFGAVILDRGHGIWILCFGFGIWEILDFGFLFLDLKLGFDVNFGF